MSATIDTKVVEMKFDNDQFEKGVAESMSTLDKLKEKLKNTGDGESLKGLSEAADKVDLSNMADSVEALKNRFSVMGIVGMTAIQNIANSVVNLGKRVVTAIPSQIANGGWTRAMNLENAKFQLEGLGYTWDKVGKQINNAVAGTAYSLDSAAKAAGSLVASGVAIEGEGDKLEQSLKAISGVAAQTNSDYDSIASIFTTVAGNGKLMTMQLQQLSNRGLNAAATLAKVLGTTEANVRSMVSNGEIDFETFSNAMNEAFGEHAFEANNTFEGALANMKAALSKIGAGFAEPIIQNAVPVFNALRLKINECKDAIAEFAGYDLAESAVYEKDIGNLKAKLESVNEAIANGTATEEEAAAVQDELNGKIHEYYEQMSPFEKAVRYLSTGITNIINKIDTSWISNVGTIIVNACKGIWSFLAPIGRAFSDVFNNENKSILSQVTDILANLSQKLILNNNAMNGLYQTFKGVFSIFDLFGTIIHEILGLIPSLDSNTFSLAEQIFKVTGFIGNLITNLTTLIKESGIIKTVIVGIKNTIVTIISTIAGGIVYVAELIAHSKTAQVILSALENVLIGIVAAVYIAVTSIAKLVTKFVALFNTLNPGFKQVNSLSDVFSNLGTVLKTLGKTISTLVQSGLQKLTDKFPALSSVISVVSSVLSGLGSVISGVYTHITEFASRFIYCIQNGINPFTDALNRLTSTTLPNIKKHFSTLISKIQEFANKFEVTRKISSVISFIAEKILYLKDCVLGLFGKGSDGVSVTEGSREMVTILGESVPLAAKQLEISGDSVESFGSKLKTFLSNLDAGKIAAIGFTVAITALGIKLIKICSNIGDLMSTVNSTLKKVGSGGIVGIIFGNEKKQTKSLSKVLEVAVAIGILAASLKLISTIDSSQLMGVSISMGALAGELIVMMGAMTLFEKLLGKEKSLSSVGKVMMEMAAAVGIMALTLKLLSSIQMDDSILENILTMIVIEQSLVLMAVELKTFAKDLSIGILTLVGFALSVSILAGALKKLSGIDGSSIDIKVVGYFLAIVAGFAAISAVAGKLSMGMFVGFLGAALALRTALPILQDAFNSINMDSVKAKMLTFKDMLIEMGVSNLAIIAGIAALLAVGVILGKASQAFGIGLLAFAGAVWVLSNVAKKCGELKTEELKNGWITLGVIGGILALIEGLSKLVNGKSILAFSVSLVLITTMMAIIAGLAVVVGMVDTAQIIKGCVVVGVIGALVAALEVASSKTENAKTGPIVAALVGLAVVLAETIVISMLMKEHGSEIIVAFGIMVIVLHAMKKAFETIGKMETNTASAVGLLLMAIMLAEIGAALYLVSGQDWGGLMIGTTAMIAVIVALVGAFEKIGATGKTFSANKLTSMKLMCLVLAEIGAALYLVSLNPWDSILAATVGMSACMVAFGACVQAIGSVKVDSKSILALLPMVVVLGAIAASLYVVSLNPWDSILAAMGAMSVTLLALTVALAILSGLDTKGIIAGAAGLLIASVSLMGIGVALNMLASVEWGAVGKMAVGLLALVGALTVLALIGSSMAVGLILAAAAMVVVSAALVVMAAALVIMNEVEWGSVGKMVVGLLALVAALTVLSFIGTGMAVGLILAAAAMVVVSAALVVMAAALVIMNEVEWGSVGKMAVVLLELVAALTILALVGTGMAVGMIAASAAMVILAAALILIANALVTLNDVDWGSVGKLAVILLELVVAVAALGAIGTIFSVGILALAAALLAVGVAAVGIGAGIMLACTGISQLTVALTSLVAVNIAGVAEQMLYLAIAGTAMLAGAPGLLVTAAALFVFSNAFSSVVSNISTVISTEWSTLPTTVTTIGHDVVLGLKNGLEQGWNDYQKAIENQAAVIGEGTLEAFRQALDTHSPSRETTTMGMDCVLGLNNGLISGDAIYNPKKEATNISEDTIEGFEEPLKIDSEGKSTVTKESGQAAVEGFEEGVTDESLWTRIKNKVSQFVSWISSKFSEAGNAISGFTQAVDTNTDSGKDWKETAKETVEEMISEYIPATDDLSSATEDATLSLDDYSSSATSATSANSELSSSYEDLRSSIESAIDPFEAFSTEVDVTADEILNNMQSQIDGIMNWAAMLMDLANKGLSQSLLQYLAELGPSGYKYVAAFETMTAEQLAAANIKFSQVMVLDEYAASLIGQAYTRAGQYVSQGFINGVDSAGVIATMSQLGTDSLAGFNNAYGIASPSKQTYQSARYVVQGFINGLGTKKAGGWREIETKLGLIAQDGLAAITRTLNSSEGYNIGYNLCQGLVNGIQAGTPMVVNAAYTLGLAASAATRNATAVESPSKVFKEIGRYLAVGMAIGIENNTDKVEKASSQMGNAAIDRMRMVAASVLDFLNTDNSFEPTIRPVLDLSGIQNGTADIASIFNSASIPTNITVGSISAKMEEADASRETTIKQPAQTVQNYTFNQTNNSPKALDRYQIYRQTRNQIAMMKGVMS